MPLWDKAGASLLLAPGEYLASCDHDHYWCIPWSGRRSAHDRAVRPEPQTEWEESAFGLS